MVIGIYVCIYLCKSSYNYFKSCAHVPKSNMPQIRRHYECRKKSKISIQRINGIMYAPRSRIAENLLFINTGVKCRLPP